MKPKFGCHIAGIDGVAGAQIVDHHYLDESQSWRDNGPTEIMGAEIESPKSTAPNALYPDPFIVIRSHPAGEDNHRPDPTIAVIVMGITGVGVGAGAGIGFIVGAGVGSGVKVDESSTPSPSLLNMLTRLGTPREYGMLACFTMSVTTVPVS
jgi:hypothetical protein